MSVLWFNDDGWILSHSSFLYDLYDSVSPRHPCKSCGKYSVFHISQQFLRREQKKPATDTGIFKTDVDAIHQDNEGARIRKCFSKFIDEAIRLQKWIRNDCSLSNINNELAVNASVNVLRETEHTKEFCSFHGGNVNFYSIAVEFENEKYLIPPHCSFYCCNVFEIKDKITDFPCNRFDVIVMDPPWRNKHIRRKNLHVPHEGYNLMHELDLVSLPIDDLLSFDGLVAVWCTNSVQQMNCLLEKIFPAWNIHYLATWYWVKVTEAGEPVCQFSDLNGKKQPFERIIFGCRAGRLTKYKNPDPNKLVVSIPSSIHSHKPPLSNVLVDYIPANARCLELFARYLIPHWVSCGNEVLKLQHHSLFE